VADLADDLSVGIGLNPSSVVQFFRELDSTAQDAQKALQLDVPLDVPAWQSALTKIKSEFTDLLRVVQEYRVGSMAMTAAAALGLRQMSAAAQEDEQVLRTLRGTFDDLSTQAEQFADSISTMSGRAASDVQALATRMYLVSEPMAASREEAAAMTHQMTELAVNVAARMGTSIDEVENAFVMGMAGMDRGLRRFGLSVKEAALEAEALKRGLDPKDLDENTKATLRWALILQQGSKFAGAAAKDAGTLGNAELRLASATKDAMAAMGVLINDVLAPVVSGIASVVTAFKEWVQEHSLLATAFTVLVLGGMAFVALLGSIGATMTWLWPVINAGAVSLGLWGAAADKAAASATRLAAAQAGLSSQQVATNAVVGGKAASSLGYHMTGGLTGMAKVAGGVGVAAVGGWALGRAADAALGLGDAYEKMVKKGEEALRGTESLRAGVVSLAVGVSTLGIGWLYTANSMARVKQQTEQLDAAHKRLLDTLNPKELEKYHAILEEGVNKYTAAREASNEYQRALGLLAREENLMLAQQYELEALLKKYPQLVREASRADAARAKDHDEWKQAIERLIGTYKLLDDVLQESALIRLRANKQATQEAIAELTKQRDARIRSITDEANALRESLKSNARLQKDAQKAGQFNVLGNLQAEEQRIRNALAMLTHAHEVAGRDFIAQLRSLAAERVKVIQDAGEKEADAIREATAKTIDALKDQMRELDNKLQELREKRKQAGEVFGEFMQSLKESELGRRDPRLAEIERRTQSLTKTFTQSGLTEEQSAEMTAGMKADLQAALDMKQEIAEAEKDAADAKQVWLKDDADAGRLDSESYKAMLAAEEKLAKLRETEAAVREAIAAVDARTEAARAASAEKAAQEEQGIKDTEDQRTAVQEQMLAAKEDEKTALENVVTEVEARLKTERDILATYGLQLDKLTAIADLSAALAAKGVDLDKNKRDASGWGTLQEGEYNLDLQSMTVRLQETLGNAVKGMLGLDVPVGPDAKGLDPSVVANAVANFAMGQEMMPKATASVETMVAEQGEYAAAVTKFGDTVVEKLTDVVGVLKGAKSDLDTLTRRVVDLEAGGQGKLATQGY
jgi:hypothetical protein